MRAAILAALLCAAPLIAQAQSPQIVRECTAHLPKSCGSCVGQMPAIVTCEIEKTYPQAQPWVVQACVRQLFASVSN